jgi:hypothetical protein
MEQELLQPSALSMPASSQFSAPLILPSLHAEMEESWLMPNVARRLHAHVTLVDEADVTSHPSLM